MGKFRKTVQRERFGADIGRQMLALRYGGDKSGGNISRKNKTTYWGAKRMEKNSEF